MIVALVLLAAVLVAPSGAAAPPELDGCEPAATKALTVGDVACRVLPSAAPGGTTAFSYHLPAACGHGARCPTLLLLHGFGGTHRSMLATPGEPSAWVRALTSAPPPGWRAPPAAVGCRRRRCRGR